MSESLVTTSLINSKPEDNSREQTTIAKTFLRKDAFVEPDSQMFDEIVAFLNEKLISGNGEILYQLGSADNESDLGLTEIEFNKSIVNLDKVCSKLNADYSQLKNSSSSINNRNGDQKSSAFFLIRRQMPEDDFNEVRISVLGNVDAGKSTLLSVLTHGQLDDGRGSARQKLFRHKHEMESGRTSSVGNDILGFDSKGNIVNQPSPHSNNLNWTQICSKSSKLISFIDLCGHEKYLKTTIFGMTGLIPNYCMLMIGGNAGIIGSTKEHLGLSLALKVPLFIVITKIDSTPKNVLDQNLKVLLKILKSSLVRKSPIMVQTLDDVLLAANNFSTSKLCPIFQISCVTGKNLDLLKMFLNLVSPKHEASLDNEPAEFQIDEVYSVPGTGTVISGLTLKGVIRTNDILYLGPTKLNKFEQIAVKSIHRKRMSVKEVRSGQSASFALKKFKKSDIRKGMVLVAPINGIEPLAYMEFYAEILILHHPSTISKNYQAMLHCGSIRQTATIISMDKENLRTGDKATVRLKFLKNPEYIKPNQSLVFREGRTKAIGKVLSVVAESSTATISNFTNKNANKKIKRLINGKTDHKKTETNENDDLNIKNVLNKNRTK